jgi:tetratricopeptide (TPR) repeat protein
VFYPYIKTLPAAAVLGAVFVLSVVTAVAWRMRRDQPAILVGWLWFLGTLVPVIGFVQIGTQAYADRYTYIPYVGLFIAMAWTAVALAERARISRAILAGAAVIVVFAFAVVAHAQTATWQNAETMWLQAVRVTTNARGHDQLGVIYAKRNELAKASAEFQLALQSNPDPSDERLIEPNLGRSLAAQGRVAEALPHWLRAVQYQPDQAEFRHQLALAYIGLDRRDEAIAAWAAAVRLNPNYEEAYYAMGVVLAGSGRPGDAVRAFQEVLRINPSRTDARDAIKSLTGK